MSTEVARRVGSWGAGRVLMLVSVWLKGRTLIRLRVSWG